MPRRDLEPLAKAVAPSFRSRPLTQFKDPAIGFEPGFNALDDLGRHHSWIGTYSEEIPCSVRLLEVGPHHENWIETAEQIAWKSGPAANFHKAPMTNPAFGSLREEDIDA